jgi:hypothetical protein
VLKKLQNGNTTVCTWKTCSPSSLWTPTAGLGPQPFSSLKIYVAGYLEVSTPVAIAQAAWQWTTTIMSEHWRSITGRVGSKGAREIPRIRVHRRTHQLSRVEPEPGPEGSDRLSRHIFFLLSLEPRAL